MTEDCRHEWKIDRVNTLRPVDGDPSHVSGPWLICKNCGAEGIEELKHLPTVKFGGEPCTVIQRTTRASDGSVVRTIEP